RMTTGPEIWAQSGGAVDAWIASVGTGATFLGVAAALRSFDPSVICVAVEPQNCQTLESGIAASGRHTLQGTGYGRPPPKWQPGLMDFSIAVSDEETAEWRERLATREGLHVGYSSAANVCAASRL